MTARRELALRVLASVLASAEATRAVSAQARTATAPVEDLRSLASTRSQFTFGHLRGARELSDGRVLVSDERERAILVVSADGTTRRSLGRRGDGPGEYRNPGDAFAMGGDSTVFVDADDGRWYLLDGTSFVGLPAPWRAVQPIARNATRGIGRRGDALILNGAATTKTGGRTSPVGWVGDADTLFAIVVRASGAHDTLTGLSGHPSGSVMVHARLNGTFGMRKIRNPLISYDQAVMFVDGSVAVARSNPYRVSYIRVDGTRSEGPIVEAKGREVSSEVRARAAAGYLRNDDGTSVFGPKDFPRWPQTVPAFTSSALCAGYDGRLYVSRTRIHPTDELFIDVFDASGVRLRSLRLPMGARLLGASTRHLLIALSNDEEDEVLVRVSTSFANR